MISAIVKNNAHKFSENPKKYETLFFSFAKTNNDKTLKTVTQQRRDKNKKKK